MPDMPELCRFVRWGCGFVLAAGLLVLALAGVSVFPRGASAGDAGFTPPEPPADAGGRLAHIRDRGTLIVGVKSDYPPWGMVDDQGDLVGMEPDMAADVARALDVELELEPVTTSNRLRKVQDGEIDLVIATMGDTPSRRGMAGVVQPHYYRSGVELLTRKDTPFQDWGQLRGRPVCLTAGSYFNRQLIERFLIDPVVFEGTRDTQLALKNGRCVGWAYDGTSLRQIVQREEWAAFHLPFEPILTTPWAVAVRKRAEDAAWGRFMADMVAHWHRSGRLLELESEWGLSPSPYLEKQHEIWTRKQPDGQYLCRRAEQGAYPPGCVSGDISRGIQSGGGPTGIARVLQSTLGVDFSPLYDGFDRQRLIRGILVTAALSLAAIVGSLGCGVVLAWGDLRLGRLMRMPVRALVDLARMTPPILQLYILFFGLGGLLASRVGLTLDAFLVASVVFSLYAGASNAVLLADTTRNLQGADPEAPGFFALFPETVDRAYEGLVATSVNIVKAVGLASTIALPEVVSATNGIVAQRGNEFAMMNFLLAFYFVFVIITMILLKSLRGLVTRWLRAS